MQVRSGSWQGMSANAWLETSSIGVPPWHWRARAPSSMALSVWVVCAASAQWHFGRSNHIRRSERFAPIAGKRIHASPGTDALKMPKGIFRKAPQRPSLTGHACTTLNIALGTQEGTRQACLPWCGVIEPGHCGRGRQGTAIFSTQRCQVNLPGRGAPRAPLPDVVKEVRMYEQTAGFCPECFLGPSSGQIVASGAVARALFWENRSTPFHPDRSHFAIAHTPAPQAHAHPPRRVPRISARRWPLGY